MVWLQDGAPLMVLHRTKAREPLRVSSSFPDVELFFADDLHRTTFFSKLPPKGSTRSSLEKHCIDRLTRSPAVAWNPSGLSAIAGPLAFALNRGSHGCLSLTLNRDHVMLLDGAVSSRPLSSAPSSLRRPPGLDSAFRSFVRATPMNNRLALHWQGASTKPLFSSLLQRPLISDGIEKNYGLTPDFQAAWLQTPMDLQVQLRKDGPFKASVQLSLAFQARHAEVLKTGLASVASNLEQRGLRPQVTPSTDGRNKVRSTDLIWKDANQHVLGRWSVESKPDHISLQLVLGGPLDAALAPLKLKPKPGLSIRFDAKQLRDIGWLSATWPSLVQQAGQGELWLKPMLGNRSGQADTWFWLKGQLSLR
jgi:hypothetical protein